MNFRMFAVFYLVAVTVNLFLGEAHAGERCAQCPANPGDPPCTVGIGIPCNSDCSQNHNSSLGTCDIQYNCLCSGLQSGNPNADCHYQAGFTTLTNVCHCKENDPKWNGICQNDCQCNHGAKDGTCDYTRHQCQCNYPAGWTWSNGSDGNPTCQFQGGYNTTQALLDAVQGSG